MKPTDLFIAAYIEGRTRLEQLIIDLTEGDMRKKLHDCPNSIGFLIQHISEVELLFAKNVFKNNDVHIVAKTIIDQKDNGNWTNYDDLIAHLEESKGTLLSTLKIQMDEAWNEFITTKEFGTKTKAEAFGRIITHTAYHAGQIALIKKYGE